MSDPYTDINFESDTNAIAFLESMGFAIKQGEIQIPTTEGFVLTPHMLQAANYLCNEWDYFADF